MEQSYQYVANGSVVSCDLNGGSVLLDLETSQYFGLNAVGLVIWETLATPATLDEVVEKVQARFEVTTDRCKLDVQNLINQLLERRLIQLELSSVDEA